MKLVAVGRSPKKFDREGEQTGSGWREKQKRLRVVILIQEGRSFVCVLMGANQ